MKLKKSKTPRQLYLDLIPPIAEKHERFVTRMGGNEHSNVFLIAPHPDESECSRNIPFSSQAAVSFCSLFEEVTKMKLWESALIMCGSHFGERTSKASFQGTIEVLRAFAKNEKAMFICIGGDNFKHLFGRGRKPSDSSLTGRAVRIKEVKFRPVFYFPDISLLEPQYQQQKGREAARSYAILKNTQIEFVRFLGKFLTFYETKYRPKLKKS